MPNSCRRPVSNLHLKHRSCYLIAQNGDPSKEAIAFSSGKDVHSTKPADLELIESDLKGSEAHAKMLAKVGILTKSEAEKISSGLKMPHPWA